jgi:ATP synthase protein I
MSFDPLLTSIQQQVKRMKRAARDRSTVLARTVYLGTVGLMLALPIVVGAYLGSWLDEHARGFSFSWTVSLIVAGVLVGFLNVYVFVRKSLT